MICSPHMVCFASWLMLFYPPQNNAQAHESKTQDFWSQSEEVHQMSSALRSKMERQWLCLCIWLHTTGYLTDSSLFQTPPCIIALNSNTTEIACVIKSEELSNQGIYWYRWSKGTKTFQFIAFATMMNRYTYGNGFKDDRFCISKDSFRKSLSLKILRLQPSDNGTYYCAVSHSSMLILGNGTELSVVDSLPPAKKAKEEELYPKKTSNCRNMHRSSRNKKGASCSSFIWAPLLTCAVLLLLALAVVIHRFQRLRRRLRLHFRKQVLK
ncbi:T-cell surface glycoprotein CD8 beta chain [Alligator sinensis]|uniref:T-cell surface glycoprotein CD8 beta chain n=1 Tax=Alligator sinensis TaxID=38654 RepID=A0A3Q0H637_ALLSI|nr:T-cell surface glycoprotein CD8 beta chain [Alligator sinensis]